MAAPVAQIALGIARLGVGNRPQSLLAPEFLGSAVVFVPMGLITGWGLVFLLRRAASRAGRWLTAAGFLLAYFPATASALFSGLLLPPLLGTLLYGVPPLAAGTGIGFGLGAVWDSCRDEQGRVGWGWKLAIGAALALGVGLGVAASIMLSGAIAFLLHRSGVVPGA